MDLAGSGVEPRRLYADLNPRIGEGKNDEQGEAEIDGFIQEFHSVSEK
jgi:hypothetical protein